MSGWGYVPYTVWDTGPKGIKPDPFWHNYMDVYPPALAGQFVVISGEAYSYDNRKIYQCGRSTDLATQIIYADDLIGVMWTDPKFHNAVCVPGCEITA